LEGKIDSTNSPQVRKELEEIVAANPGMEPVLDAEGLSYISSAGLRVLLQLTKSLGKQLTMRNVTPEVYEIMDITGFTDILNVRKKLRELSVEDCEIIGRGAIGTVYRIDDDTIVKVYEIPDCLPMIENEQKRAKQAFLYGIPTAISYDVVKVGDSYGSVFELLNASSFSKILATEPERMDWCVKEYVDMLRKIHGTLVPEGKLPDVRLTALGWAEFMRDYLPEEAGAKLVALVEAVPHDDHMIHGDYHTKNLELQNDEVLLIDMDTLAVGHPIFELASIYNSFVGYSEYDHEVIRRFQGFDRETGVTFWRKSLAAYLGTANEMKLREVEDKARVVGYTRMIRRSIRRGGLETPEGRAEIDLWKSELLELLEQVDALTFDPDELELEAVVENLPYVQEFIDSHLEKTGCPPRAQMQIGLAAEEIFVNIASYAYAPGTGTAVVRIRTQADPKRVTITFLDQGVPYDPLEKPDPDITLSAEERQIGGLGIYMVKKSMDDMKYEYRDGQNVLTIEKTV
jgi:uncharacterized protein (TIGR02172 family)